MKNGRGRSEGSGASFPPPFQGSPGWGFHPGFRRSGSTLGYIPAAASRLKVFAILPDIKVMHDTLEGYFRKSHWLFRPSSGSERYGSTNENRMTVNGSPFSCSNNLLRGARPAESRPPLLTRTGKSAGRYRQNRNVAA